MIVDFFFVQNVFWDVVILYNVCEGVLGLDLKDVMEVYLDFFDVFFIIVFDIVLIRKLYEKLQFEGEKGISLLQVVVIFSIGQV